MAGLNGQINTEGRFHAGGQDLIVRRDTVHIRRSTYLNIEAIRNPMLQKTITAGSLLVWRRTSEIF